jgi:hypothetical protein
LQCVLAARILIVDFIVCTLAVKKKNQGRFRHVGSDHSLVSLMLRPRDSRPDYLGIKHTSEVQDQIFISVRQLRVC